MINTPIRGQAGTPIHENSGNGISASNQLADEQRSIPREVYACATEPGDHAVLHIKLGVTRSYHLSGEGDAVVSAEAAVESQPAQYHHRVIYIDGDRIAGGRRKRSVIRRRRDDGDRFGDRERTIPRRGENDHLAAIVGLGDGHVKGATGIGNCAARAIKTAERHRAAVVQG